MTPQDPSAQSSKDAHDSGVENAFESRASAHEFSSSEMQSSRGILGWLKRTRPTSIQILLALVGVQWLALSLYTVWGVLNLVAGKVQHISVALVLIACTAGASWFLFVLLRGIGNGQPWVRGPLVTVQIFVLLVGVSTVQSTMWWAGIVLLAYGVATLAALFARQSTAFIGVRDLPQS